MKLLIQKTNETKGNIKKIELTSSDFKNNTNTYVIKENEFPIIYLTDTQSSYFIDDIDSKLERVNSETVAIITIYDLISLGGGTGGDSRPYKVYTALLTQSGTDAPVATVLENTLGGDVIWSRDSVGQYKGEANSIFTENTIGYIYNVTTEEIDVIAPYGLVRVGLNNDVLLTTSVGDSKSDDILYYSTIEIRVYN